MPGASRHLLVSLDHELEPPPLWNEDLDQKGHVFSIQVTQSLPPTTPSLTTLLVSLFQPS